MDDEKNPKLGELRRKAMALPLLPGVYIMKDAQNTIIYIGKAKALKNRVSQYFGSDANHPEKVRRMVRQVDHFDYIIADSEFEALVLECSLIKQYMPKYNILLKDSKGYHYIGSPRRLFSRIAEVRQLTNDGARYLGPYVSSMAVQQSVDEVNRIFSSPPVTVCFPGISERIVPVSIFISSSAAPPAPAAFRRKNTTSVWSRRWVFDQGGRDAEKLLTERMEAAAERLEFEKAARYRDRITAIRRISQKQKVVMSRIEEQDIIALAQGAGGSASRFSGLRKASFTTGSTFFWRKSIRPPPRGRNLFSGIIPCGKRSLRRSRWTGELEDRELLEQWLGEKAGRRVHIVQPQRGEQAQLVEMCRNNAAERIAQKAGMAGRDAAALDELARLLGLKEPPLYIESYDISHTGGTENVVSMVVFENGRPLKAAYRKFIIKTVTGQDDYGSLRRC